MMLRGSKSEQRMIRCSALRDAAIACNAVRASRSNDAARAKAVIRQLAALEPVRAAKVVWIARLGASDYGGRCYSYFDSISSLRQDGRQRMNCANTRARLAASALQQAKKKPFRIVTLLSLLPTR
jgi:hypothetical protein